MYLISSKYYLKRRVTNKAAKRLLHLNAALYVIRYIGIVAIAIYFAPCVALCLMIAIVIPSPHEKPPKRLYNANCLLCAIQHIQTAATDRPDLNTGRGSRESTTGHHWQMVRRRPPAAKHRNATLYYSECSTDHGTDEHRHTATVLRLTTYSGEAE